MELNDQKYVVKTVTFQEFGESKFDVRVVVENQKGLKELILFDKIYNG